MSPEKSLSRYILVILSVSIVFTALIIVALNAYVSNKKLSESNKDTFLNNALSSFSYEDGYKDGYKEARAKFNLAPSELRAITGTVKSITPDLLTIEAINLDTDEFVDGVSNVRTATITASTTYVLRTDLNSEELSKKMSEWRNSTNPEKSPLLLYTDKVANYEDLKPGQKVLIKVNEDVRFKESFEAGTITITADAE